MQHLFGLQRSCAPDPAAGVVCYRWGGCSRNVWAATSGRIRIQQRSHSTLGWQTAKLETKRQKPTPNENLRRTPPRGPCPV